MDPPTTPLCRKLGPWTTHEFSAYKNDFLGFYPGLNSFKMDPKIAHSIPDGSPRKK